MELMNISQKGIDLIKGFESLRLSAYRDSVGIPTIGFGHTSGVKMGMTISKTQAEQFLKEDISPIEKALNSLNINLKQSQFDSLCSWIFNLGISKFNSSTMKKYIVQKRQDTDITDQMVKWYNAGGKPLLGLKRRRIKEANMWLGKDVYYIDNVGNIKRK